MEVNIFLNVDINSSLLFNNRLWPVKSNAAKNVHSSAANALLDLRDSSALYFVNIGYCYCICCFLSNLCYSVNQKSHRFKNGLRTCHWNWRSHLPPHWIIRTMYCLQGNKILLLIELHFCCTVCSSLRCYMCTVNSIQTEL